MATRMQQRKGTAAQWVSTNNGDGPILNAGEIGYESDTNKFKIGDGVNHWVDLNYFLDAEALGGNIDDYIPLTQKGANNGVAELDNTGKIPSSQIPSLVGLDSEITTAVNNAVNALVDGAPAALNTLNELAAAVNDNSSFAAEVIAEINTKQDIITGVSDVEIGYLNGVTSAIQTQISDIAADVTSLETNKADASTLAENIIDTMAGALTEGTDIVITHNDVANTITIAAGTGLATNQELADAVSTHSNDTTSVHGITDTAELATKTFAANLLVNATKTNIQITGDKDGISIVAENGVADSTTDNLSEGTTNKYFTDERAQDAVGNALGTGLSYNDPSGAISVDQTVMQARVANVSDIEIGYLDGVTSAIQTQINAKAPSADPTFTGTVSGVTKSHVGLGNVDNTADANKPISSATQTALDLKLASGTAATTYAPIASPTFTGTVSGVTKAHVGLGNVDNTSDANKPISSATQTALDAKLASATAATTYAPIASPTFTGSVTLPGAPTSDLHAATKLYVDNVTAGINFHESVHAASTTNLATTYANGTSGVGATLTADTSRAFAVLDGESVVLGQRVLIKNQTDAKQNGIYTLTTVGSVSAPWVLTRATDADNNPTGEMKTGDFVFVQNGTVNASVGYINNSTANPIVIGTDNISYVEFSAGKTVVAGSGLTEAVPGTLSIATGAITSAMIADGSIVDADVNASAAIAKTKIAGTAITAADTGTVTSTMILDGTIATGDIADGAITTAKIADGAVATVDIADGAVTSAKIADGAIVNADINASAAIAQSKIDGLSSSFAAKADLNSPTFTGTVAGITKSMVGLGNVDNTTDANKPVSTATQTALNAKSDAVIVINAQTSNYTLALTDFDDLVEMNVGSANTLTVPTNSSVALPVGTRIHVVQTGSGQTTITPAGGVTVNGTPGLKTRAQWSAVTLVKRATDTWVAFGDLTA
jgi:hypothetical protein